MNIQSIPASKLVASPKNVRQRPSISDDELMSSIATLGVIQNLVVAAVKKPKGSFEVIAGGRRLNQVNRLISAGTFASDYALNCLVIDADADATLISLNENFHREDMNPADEALAFKTLMDNGADADTVAKSMSVTSRYVMGRMSLCDLAPEIFQALAAGDITLDVAQAFTVRPEHDLQQAIFSQFGNYAWSPEQIRTRLTAQSVKANSPSALLVGREAYIAAGGKTLTDLFASKDEELWTSPEILEPLVAQQLAAQGDRLSSEMNIGRVIVYPGSYVPYNATEGYVRYDVPSREPTEPEAARMAELEQSIAQYEDHECESDQEYDEIEAKIQGWQSEIEAVQASLAIIPEEDREALVQFATLAPDGSVVPSGRFLVARERAKSGTSAPTTNGNPQQPDEKSIRPISAKLSAALAEDRTNILRLYIASNPTFALNLLAFLLADSKDYNSGFEANSGAPNYGSHGSSAETRIQPLDDLRQSLNYTWRSGDITERFDKFMTLTDDDRVALLAAAVARSATASPTATPLQSHIAQLLEVDVASQWRPTEENYWSQVPAARIHDAFDQIDGQELRNRYAGVKKGELAQAAESIFTGQSVSLEPTLRAAASTWVPEAMTFTTPKSTTVDDDADDLLDDEDETLEQEDETDNSSLINQGDQELAA